MIDVYSLGSGSKGNCFALTDGKTCVLIDAGLSPKTTQEKLSEIGVTERDIQGVLLTHEHSDHVKSIGILSETYKIYSHEDTFSQAEKIAGGLNGKNLCHVEETFSVGGFEITPFPVSHDAAHPYGFIVKNDDSSVGYVTDTGYLSKGVMKKLLGCDEVVLESNHDVELLLRGVYPPRLQKRILSDRGHLCNEECALAVRDLALGGTKKFLLAHLSENNNLSELAYWTTKRTLEEKGITEEVTVKVAYQRRAVLL